MADDTYTPDPQQVRDSAKATSEAADAIDEAGKVGKKATLSLRGLRAELNGLPQRFRKLTQSITPAVREVDAMREVSLNASKGMVTLEKTMKVAMLQGNKQALAAMISMRRFGETLRDTARTAARLSTEIDSNSASLRKNIGAITEQKNVSAELAEKLKAVSSKIEELNELQRKGTVLTESQRKALAEYQNEQGSLVLKIEDVTTAVKELEHENVRLENSIQENVVAYDKLQNKVIEVREQMLSELETRRKANRELRIMAGGTSAVGAAMEEVTDSKFFEYLKKAGTLAFVTSGLLMAGQAIAEMGSHARTVGLTALSMGDAGENGFGRFAKSASEASQTANKLTGLSSRLGYSIEELNDVSNKMRLGVRFDREGRLSEKAIQGLTEETARFARVTGVDLETSTELISKRIKNMGMTAEQAVGSMQEMRATLMQMSAGAKENAIDMGEMVRIIDEAAESSQSFVVDTRIMTQALRGAVTQATQLGASQKQAKEVAKGLGKVFSQAPDYIKVPAGMNLVSKLTGDPAEAEKFLQGFDKQTQVQLRDMQRRVKSGEIGSYSAAKAMMDLVGQSAAGQEEIFKGISDTILGSAEAGELVAQQFGIENRAVAQQMVNVMKDARKFQKDLGDAKVDFSVAIAKQASEFNEAIKDAESSNKDATEVLKEKGLSAKDAETYLKMRKEAVEMETKINEERKKIEASSDPREEKARKLAELDRKLFMETTVKQTQFLDDATHPAKRIIKDLQKALPDRKDLNIHTDLDAEALRKAGIDNAKDLAAKFGITGDANIKKLEAVYKGDQKVTANELDMMHTADLEVLKKQEAAMESLWANFDKGLIPGLKGIFDGVLSFFGVSSPLAKLGLGLVTAIGGVALLMRGQKKILDAAVNAMASPVKKGTLEALSEWGGGPGAGKPKPGTGGPGGGGPKKLPPGDGVRKRLPPGGEGKLDTSKMVFKPVSDKPVRVTPTPLKRLPPGKIDTGRMRFRPVGKASFSGGGKGLKSGLAQALQQAATAGMVEGGGCCDPNSSGISSVVDNLMDLKKHAGKTEKEITKSGKLTERATKLAEKVRSNKLISGTVMATKNLRAAMAGGEAVTGGGGGGLMSKMATKVSGKGGLLKAGLKGLKLAKAIPLVGTVVGAGFALKQAWELYKKWKEDPNSITPSDKVKMAAELGSMIPGIGSAIAVADAGAEMTGGYEALDKAMGVPPAGAVSPVTGATAGSMVTAPDTGVGGAGGGEAGRAASAAAQMASNSLKARANSQSVTPDGALTLKVEGFADILANYNRKVSNAT